MFSYTTAIDKIRKVKARKKIIQGGTSAGKTYAILAILIDKAARTPNTEISVVSESIPHLRRGCIKDFLKIMKETGRFNEANFNKTYLKYEFTNGSYIEFFSADDDSKMRGARRNILYINEANNVSFESYIQLAIRTSGEIYLDFNPVARFWAHTEIENEDDAELLIINYKDNEGLPQSIIDMLEQNRVKALTSSYWENWCRVYLDGLIGNLEGAVFPLWDEVDRIPEEAKLIGYGLDFGFTHDPSVLLGIYKMDDNIYVDEIIYQKGLSNSELASIAKDNGVFGEIYADAAEPKSISELRRYGLRILPAQKGKDSILFGISTLHEYNIFITSRSNNTKDEFGKYTWKKDGEGRYMNVPIDTFNHSIDALRYLAIMKLTKKNTGIKTFRIG
jgi:phage terminase large subunit